MHLASIKPIDGDLIVASARKTGCAVTAELATINGGFGSAVAEVLGERCPVPIRRVGYLDVWPHSGSIQQHLEHYRLRPADVAAAARELIELKGAREW